MVEQFLNHLQRHKLCKTSDKILLAVSGGLDSMVMLDIFLRAGFTPAVAHCNFQLRGADSDGDEAFVKEVCAKQALTFHHERFNTLQASENSRDSIQVTARNLRYEFFNKLRSQHQYQYLATAHHVNDNLETVLLNLTRGSGIEGLAGIPVKNDWIIRPMLFASREMILRYANENEIRWREDSSNASDDYQRNFIRHHVIPRLKELNPSLEQTFEKTAERIQGASELAIAAIQALQKEAVKVQGGKTYINIEKLRSFHLPEVALWELIKHQGFNYYQCCLIVQEHQPGKIFSSVQAELVIDRDHYIIADSLPPPFETVNVNRGQHEVTVSGNKLLLREVSLSEFQLRKKHSIAQLDADTVTYPLVWRQWKQGDSLIPLGMKHHKKVSDLLIDEKISLPDKRSVSVVESDGNIVWVVGIRIHDHYKVTEKTRKVLIIESLPV